jgi:hypothetical protein
LRREEILAPGKNQAKRRKRNKTKKKKKKVGTKDIL